MASTLKYQEDFAAKLTQRWLAGQRTEVRITIRTLSYKAQVAYIAAQVAANLDPAMASEFCAFMHPNKQGAAS